MCQFCHIHNHSEYSTYDGFQKINPMVKRAKEMGMTSLAITDHGNLGGCIKFYEACKKEGIKPLLGCEMYIAYDAQLRGSEGKVNNHLVVLAKNDIGWQNLKKLSDLSFKEENFYYKPRIDFNLLDKYGEGLIISSACIKGEVADAMIKHGVEGYDVAKNIASRYKERFGDDYYIELMFHALGDPSTFKGNKKWLFDNQLLVLNNSVKLAQELGIKTVFSNDSHYGCSDDFEIQQIKKGIQSHRDESDEEDGRDDDFNEFYMKSPEQMHATFGMYYADALTRTMEIADKCNVDILLGSRARVRLPNFDIPVDPAYEQFKAAWGEKIGHLEDNGKYLTYQAWIGLARRGLHTSKPHVERLEYELSVVTKTEYAKYFIIVQDYIQYARSINVVTGPGRGSGAGSLMLYCLGITNVDPLKYNLSFERFLAAELGLIVEERDFL